MNADQRRWICLATVAPLVVAAGVTHCTGVEITPPSERQPAVGVAEYADEFADAEQAEKPLMKWALPFTQYAANPWFRSQRMSRAAERPLLPVRLDEGDVRTGMQQTLVEQLIENGFPTGSSADAGDPPASPDNSYHLAEEQFTFGGVTFSR